MTLFDRLLFVCYNYANKRSREEYYNNPIISCLGYRRRGGEIVPCESVAEPGGDRCRDCRKEGRK